MIELRNICIHLLGFILFILGKFVTVLFQKRAVHTTLDIAGSSFLFLQLNHYVFRKLSWQWYISEDRYIGSKPGEEQDGKICDTRRV